MVHVEIAAEELFALGPLIVTNSMVGALLASIVLLLAARWFTRRAAVVPSRGQSILELPIEFLAGIVRSTGGKRWRQFAPLIFAIFLFVLIANWLSLLPGVGTIGLWHGEGEHRILVPFVRAGAADLNFTLGLALISFVAFIAFGLRANGLRGYLKELLVSEPAYMTPLLTPIHMISELSRVISLSMRLFGNVFAGEVLLATMLALTTATLLTLPLAFVVPGVFIMLELLFGLVQALVFALLSMTYITLAIAEHRQHGSDDHHSGEAPEQGTAAANGAA
ncbi:MAG TPA: F0F1 ATP synthase subunit A [Candidatus Limnocylindria bacterium]|nr:F0F1 ATP synthase subunit A [Candidatus Limnocylindria bacterium]